MSEIISLSKEEVGYLEQKGFIFNDSSDTPQKDKLKKLPDGSYEVADDDVYFILELLRFCPGFTRSRLVDGQTTFVDTTNNERNKFRGSHN